MKPTDFASIATTLVDALQLHQPPVAVHLCNSRPLGAPAYHGRAAAGCRFWQEGADHYNCAIGVYTHNLRPSPEQQTDLVDALKVFADLGYVRPQDLPQIPVLQSNPSHVVYGPLAQAESAPDVVVLFVNSGQTLVLSEAVQQLENQAAPAMGRPACAVIAQVVNSDRAALSLGCCGARAYLDVLTNEIAIFAIPGRKIASYAERISALAKANTMLSSFHQIRRRTIEAGRRPTIKESLAAMKAQPR
jgi:uncharacterized protein (DUF169 family)